MDKLWKITAAVSKGGHDLSHVKRVYQLSLRLSEGLEVDMDILKAAVILHDIAREEEDNDPKGVIDHAVLGGETAEQILLELGWKPSSAAKVRACIAAHRYRSGLKPDSIEAQILYDADKLDSLGAVGVGRLFMLSGQYGEHFYIEPPPGFGSDKAASRITDFESYSPNLEYEIKMRKIPAKLFTEAAKAMAAERMRVMDEFFETLRAEINGEK